MSHVSADARDVSVHKFDRICLLWLRVQDHMGHWVSSRFCRIRQLLPLPGQVFSCMTNLHPILWRMPATRTLELPSIGSVCECGDCELHLAYASLPPLHTYILLLRCDLIMITIHTLVFAMQVQQRCRRLAKAMWLWAGDRGCSR